MAAAYPICPNGRSPYSQGHTEYRDMFDGIIQCIACNMYAKKVFDDRPVWVHAYSLDRLIELDNETRWTADRLAIQAERKLNGKRGMPAMRDAFEVLHLPRTPAEGPRATGTQIGVLKRYGIDGHRLFADQAKRLIKELSRREITGQATYCQVKLLACYGFGPCISKEAATKLISRLAENKWQPLLNESPCLSPESVS